MFLARRGCRGCLYVLVLQVGFLLFCALFLHCQHLPVLLPATFCLPSVASHCCLFIALARLKFYASTGCVRIGFGSILSCLFVWLCVSIWCVCVCGCVSVCVWCVAVFVFSFYSSLDAYNAFWLMLPVPSAASCLLLKQQLLVQLCHAPSPSPSLLTINLNAPLCIVKSSFCCCRLNRNVKP